MNSLQIFDSQAGDNAPIHAMRSAMTKDGAFVVKGLFSADEIEQLRDQVRKRLIQSGRRLSLGRTLPGAASVEELGWAMADPRIVAVFRGVLGSDGTLFTGHCDIHMNMLSGWHKDSGEIYGGYFSGNYFEADDCRVYKAAIYLQDAGARDGLTVRLGSHRTSDIHAGTEVKLLTKKGDVVFFDVRLNHRGQLPDVVESGIKAAAKVATRGSRVAQEPQWATELRSMYWRWIGRRDRLSMFFTYGAANRFTQEFASANIRRQIKQAGENGGAVSASLLRLLEEQGVELCEAASP